MLDVVTDLEERASGWLAGGPDNGESRHEPAEDVSLRQPLEHRGRRAPHDREMRALDHFLVFGLLTVAPLGRSADAVVAAAVECEEQSAQPRHVRTHLEL